MTSPRYRVQDFKRLALALRVGVRVLQALAQGLQPAMKQAGHGSLGGVQLMSDLGQGPSLEMMQLDHPALVLG